jgi:O-methyltransferase
VTSETKQDWPQFQCSTQRGYAAWMATRDLAPTLEKVRPFTMVPRESLIDLACQVRAVVASGIRGHFVECGVWRGGASFLMAELLRQAGVRDRKVWLFDSFEGLPPPEEIDGPAAMEYTKNTESPSYFDNCSASLEEVQRTAMELELASYTELVKGWFEQTLPAYRDRVGPIAILRIDADWYSSVRCCLANLYDQVVDGGLVILDDYYAFDGCATAVHEFFGKRKLAHRIENVVGKSEGFEHYQCALFRKGNFTWKRMYPLNLTAQEIAALIPLGDTLILVDQEEYGSEIAAGRHTIPFLERDGQYWGPPPNDATAIRELERLRRSGATFIAFAWPAFWWLEYYSGLHQHLRSEFCCILENDRLVVFDLRS